MILLAYPVSMVCVTFLGHVPFCGHSSQAGRVGGCLGVSQLQSWVMCTVLFTARGWSERAACMPH